MIKIGYQENFFTFLLLAVGFGIAFFLYTDIFTGVLVFLAILAFYWFSRD